MSGTRILLVEDSGDHRELLRLAVTRGRPGVEVHTVDSGRAFRDALDAFGPGYFDCVVMDYGLPDCVGSDLIKLLSATAPECPAIVVSSSEDQNTVVESFRSGGIDFLSKSSALCGDVLWQRVKLAMARTERVRRERVQIERRVQRLARLATTDPLTGLTNRLGLERALHGRGLGCDRRGRAACVMIDVDHFKQVNDTHGHPCGDRILVAVAQVLRASACGGITVARWGGEEFLAVIPGAHIGAAWLWAERVRRCIERQRLACDGRSLYVTVSLGVAAGRENVIGSELLTQADAALYLAKRTGRNRVCTWQMVAVDDLIRRAAATGPGASESAEARWHDVLTTARDLMGPIQREHLTVHSERVSRLGVRLAGALGCGDDRRERVRTAGLYHDFGKLVIPDDILGKCTALEPEERDLLAGSAATGAELSARLGVDPRTAECVRWHHARYNLDGAHNGPCGEAIPLEARILGVADAFTAMTSYRTYQTALSPQAAVAEIRRERGRQFDPRVVDVVESALSPDLVPA